LGGSKIRPGYFIGISGSRRHLGNGWNAPGLKHRKKLADIDDTDEPGTEDWGRQGAIIKKG